MTILVTGAAGFIGFHLINKLLENNSDVIGLDNFNNYYDVNLKNERYKNLQIKAKKLNVNFEIINADISDEEKIIEIFASNSFEKVVNLAAQAGVRYSIENPSAYINSNIKGFSNILEGCRHNQIKHLVYASSSSVYGGNQKMPFSEMDSVDHPISLYAASKKSNELMAHTYSHLYGLSATGLRFFTVYGPWGRPDMALFIFTKSIIEGKPIKLFNMGNMIRDFTYIEDIVKSLVLIINKPATKDLSFDPLKPNPSTSWAPHRIFNIGNSNPTNLEDYIKAVENTLQKKAIREYVEMQPGDVAATSSNTDALMKWINFKPNTNIQDGVANFVNWYTGFYK
tara:strand:- start:23832 stop:24851 length:1020 start_codon:yes stop_codon:yes gene_type:complete